MDSHFNLLPGQSLGFGNTCIVKRLFLHDSHWGLLWFSVWPTKWLMVYTLAAWCLNHTLLWGGWPDSTLESILIGSCISSSVMWITIIQMSPGSFSFEGFLLSKYASWQRVWSKFFKAGIVRAFFFFFCINSDIFVLSVNFLMDGMVLL